MMTVSVSNRAPGSVLGVGHFSRVLLGHSCRAPKDEAAIRRTDSVELAATWMDLHRAFYIIDTAVRTKISPPQDSTQTRVNSPCVLRQILLWMLERQVLRRIETARISARLPKCTRDR